MKTGTAIGLGLAGLAAWWWWQNYGAANGSLAAHAAVPVALPESGITVQAAVMPPVAVSQAQAPLFQTSGQLTALLNWAQGTKNPPLYAQMIAQLSPQDLASMYDLLTTYWAGVTPSPTPAQTQFWNYLRGLYPFLNTGGVGCNNLACN